MQNILAALCTNPDPIEPNNFEFTYSFGVGNHNVLDTQTNTYTKDMVCGKNIEYTLRLNEQEKELILQKINENNLLSINPDFTQNCDALGFCQNILPLSGKNLAIKTENQTKTINYRANYYDKDNLELKKFLEVAGLIEQIIRQKEQEMGMPQPTCGYM